MCGITGLIGHSHQINGTSLVKQLEAMCSTLISRGPDGNGIWVDEAMGIGLAHRRLAILDPSPAGQQPMVSPSGQYIISFNGEIYNHLELRDELLSALPVMHSWRGKSDTETLLACIETWGLRETLGRLNGMFAFALYDRHRRCLSLARDRVGEKPLYYGIQRGVFLFGSELKALEANASFVGDIDHDVVNLYLQYGYVPSPYSIYRDIQKLPAGSFLQIPLSHTGTIIEIGKPHKYWSIEQTINNSRGNLFSGTENQAIQALEDTIHRSVQRQRISDVPIGAFLSGGIDSSTVAAIMQSQSSQAIKSFSIGFNEKQFNEAIHAREIASHLGTDHTEFYVTSTDALNTIAELPLLYDEPFADSSQIPSFLLAKLARQHVTVALSGDGADELFGGYNRHYLSQKYWAKIRKVPLPARKFLSSFLTVASPVQWDSLNNWVPGTKGRRNLGRQIHKVAAAFSASSSKDLYHRLTQQWNVPRHNNSSSLQVTQIDRINFNPEDISEMMMVLDTINYLPDDILCKVDRASMGASLEVRVPFLDKEVIEFAWSLPHHLKIRNGQGKWILKELLSRYVPVNLFDRPKTGFGVPLDTWLRGPLRDWAESLLNDEKLQRHGFLDSKQIRNAWSEHLSGKANWEHKLWTILMLQAWLDSRNV